MMVSAACMSRERATSGSTNSRTAFTGILPPSSRFTPIGKWLPQLARSNHRNHIPLTVLAFKIADDIDQVPNLRNGGLQFVGVPVHGATQSLPDAFGTFRQLTAPNSLKGHEFGPGGVARR